MDCNREGFSAVNHNVGPWTHTPLRRGTCAQCAQIDLLFERADRVTTIAEMKYSEDVVTLDALFEAE
jgi:hypothetical protein